MPNRLIPRALKDWAFLGVVVSAIALVVSAEFGRTTPRTEIISALVAIWLVVLVLQYGRILELLDETKECRAELNSGLKSFMTSRADVEVAERLPVISVEAFAEKETRLQRGDSVLVFANTLETDFKPMCDAVIANLKKK